jgi:beta-glucosidase
MKAGIVRIAAVRRVVAMAVLTALAVATFASAAQAAAPSPCSDPAGKPWCNPALSPDKRAGLLVKALTRDEKISVLAGTSMNGHTGATVAISRLGIPQSYNTDGPVGIRQGSATAMPTPMALAATFDRALARLYGETLGNEARAKGNDGILAPTINMMRTPVNGRTFEAFGEDPFLVANTAAPWIEGAQSQGIYATPKHFAANNQEGYDPTGSSGNPTTPVGAAPYNTRYQENSVVDERTLNEIYLPQFEAAVRQANAGSIMCSYNKLNGPWTCTSKDLLQNTLENRWGFKGFVMSDWVFATHPFDTLNAFNNGLDLEMPFPDAYNPALVQAAFAAGQVTDATLDDHSRRLFRTLFAIGFFDRPQTDPDDSKIDKTAHAQAAQQIEESAATLLKNDGTLPLDASKVKTISISGQLADKFVTGGGSGNVTPFKTTTVLQGIKDRVGSGVKVNYDDGSDAAAAATAAKSADAAIVVVGDYQTEGADKACLTLECPNAFGDQDALVEAVAAANPHTIVVLETGGPVLTPWRDKIGALLEAWYPGESGGTAVARVLFGDVDPGGRLPSTFPEKEADLPTAGDTDKYPGSPSGDVYYKEGVLIGYRWYDAKGLTPAFPFGAGLSYTTWRYDKLKITQPTPTSAKVSFSVTNTGSRAGTDVPQLYLALPSPSPDVVQPPKALKGYQRVSLAPGQTKRVSLAVDQRALSYWDSDVHDWAVAPGCYGLMVGRSSRDIVLTGALGVQKTGCKAASAPAQVACARSGSAVVKLARRTAGSMRRATVYVNGKRVKTIRGKHGRVRVKWAQTSAATVKVRLAIRLKSGKRVVVRRTYRNCG